MSLECICAEKYADLTYFAFYGFLSLCHLLTCHLLTGNDFVIENLSQADATATPHVAPQMRPRRPTVGPNGKKPPNI